MKRNMFLKLKKNHYKFFYFFLLSIIIQVLPKNNGSFESIFKLFIEDSYTLNQLYKERVKKIKNRIENNDLDNFKKLSYEEFETQAKTFNCFFDIKKDTQSTKDILYQIYKKTKDILDILENYLSECIPLYYSFFSIKTQSNSAIKSCRQHITKDLFFNLKFEVNDEAWNLLSSFYLEGDRHTSTFQSANPTFFLGDISDRWISCSNSKKNSNRKQNQPELEIIDDYKTCFQLKKTIYLLLRNLFIHINFLSQILQKQTISTSLKAPYYLAVLGNHDYGSILYQDFQKCITPIETDECNEHYEIIYQLYLLIDNYNRLMIPTQIAIQNKKNNKILVLSHSGGELLLSDKTKEYELISNEQLNIKHYQYNFLNIDCINNYTKMMNFVPQSIKNLIKEQYNKYKNLILQNKTNPFTWCDFFSYFCENNEEIKYDIEILIPGRYEIGLYCSLMNYFIFKQNYKIEKNFIIIRARAHEHDPKKLINFFVKKEKNYCLYRNRAILSNYNSYQTEYIYLPPAYPAENLYLHFLAIDHASGKISNWKQIILFLTNEPKTIHSFLNELEKLEFDKYNPDLYQNKKYKKK